MEYFDQIEIKGISGFRPDYETIHNLTSVTFGVKTKFSFPSIEEGEDDTEIEQTTRHTIKYLIIPRTKSASFKFRPNAPIHVIGRIRYKSKIINGVKVFSDVYIEAASVEYLDEKKEG